MDDVPDMFCIFSSCLPTNCLDCGAFGFLLRQESDKVKNWVSWSSRPSLHFCVMLFGTGNQVVRFRHVPYRVEAKAERSEN